MEKRDINNEFFDKEQSKDIDNTVKNLEEENGVEGYNKIEQNQERNVCSRWDYECTHWECWMRCRCSGAWQTMKYEGKKLDN